MRIYSLNQISSQEKSNILNQHRTLYDGFRRMHPKVESEQPLYVQDFANDKNGITVSNKGEVKKYTNIGINEQLEEKEMCSECGGGMYEGECSECGYKMEWVGEQLKDEDPDFIEDQISLDDEPMVDDSDEVEDISIDSDEGDMDMEYEDDVDLSFDPKTASWEDIKAHTGNWDEIDEDLRESFVTQKNKISEMMIRMKVL